MEAKASLCAPFPSCSSPDPSTPPSFTVVACRFAPRRRRSCATQPAGRVGGPARVEFSPQAGQPNGNKKLRQTALPTPQRPVNIVAERERERGRKLRPQQRRSLSSSKDPLWIGYPSAEERSKEGSDVVYYLYHEYLSVSCLYSFVFR